MVQCPQCKGKKTLQCKSYMGNAKEPYLISELNCLTCEGKGNVTVDVAREHQARLDMWCKCKDPGESVYYEFPDGTHGYDCSICGKVLQTG